MTPPESFGQWLKARRKARDLTQGALAGRIGLAEDTIYKIEAGARRPSRQIATLLAEALGIPEPMRPAFLQAARAGVAPADLFAASVMLPPAHPAATSPIALTAMIGRAAVLAELSDLLQAPETRLLTLTGPPGMGKTRLALALAAAAGPFFPDGVTVVPLAALGDPNLVGPTIAQGLGLAGAGEMPAGPLLARHLRTRAALLVLDNFEQVIAAAPLVAGLLAETQALRIVVTSREPLRVPGEQQFPVPPLAIPDPGAASDARALADVPAVALFVARARAVHPAFTLDAHNAAAVAAICSRLEGLPLGIELAAARAKVLTAPEIAARLDHQLALLAGGPRTLPPRQQTLRGAIDWSFRLLSPGEQALLARLAVFAGGAGIGAVEAVCNAEGDLDMAVLDGITSLVDKSLARAERSGEGQARITLHAGIREYGAEQLAGRPEHSRIRRLHAEYYLALAEAAGPALRGPEQQTWLARLETEHDNLRAALDWLQARDPVAGLRLAGILAWFWELHGHLREGRARLGALLAAPGAQAPTAARAKALQAAGRLATRQDDPAAEALLLESLALARATGDVEVEVSALHNLGNVAADTTDDLDRATAYYEESYRLAQAHGDPWHVAWALIGRGWVALARGDLVAAERDFAASLALRRSRGDLWGIARSLRELGQVALAQGNYAQAQLYLEESLQRHRALGHTGFENFVLPILAQVARLQGDIDRAAHLVGESLQRAHREGSPQGVAEALLELAAVAAAQEAWEPAARLLGGAEALLAPAGAEPAALPAVYSDLPARVQAHLPGPAWVAAWTHGQALPLDELVAAAAAVAASLAGSAPPSADELGPLPS
ncbi:MAG TPA: tetratricopeptide repeat protein [Chloroflexia bacterium]|nr:tetratricopeptide repeat protein [Chloroflexia bacterium]